jgi:hypothetical protein
LILRTIILEATLPPAELVRLDSKTELSKFVIQGVVTIFCTLSISLYLIFRHWYQRKLIGKEIARIHKTVKAKTVTGKAQGSTGYVNIVSMLVESYALEPIWLLMGAILRNLAVGAFFAESVRYIEVSAP